MLFRGSIQEKRAHPVVDRRVFRCVVEESRREIAEAIEAMGSGILSTTPSWVRRGARLLAAAYQAKTAPLHRAIIVRWETTVSIEKSIPWAVCPF